MQYILLIYQNEAEAKARSQEENQKTGLTGSTYLAFTGAIKQSGQLRAGEPLEPSSTRPRPSRGATERPVTDGPFAETKEQLGGYYLIERRPRRGDRGGREAARASYGSIELRPVMEMDADRDIATVVDRLFRRDRGGRSRP